MSKHKLLYLIEMKSFETIQQLSIFVYNTTFNNKNFNFEKYFESTYETSITNSLELLKIKDIENYKDIFHKYLLRVYEMSKENAEKYIAVDVSNRKELFKYWKDNRKIFLSEIINKYKEEKL